MKRLLLLLVALVSLAACDEPRFTEPERLGGVEIAPEVLERGREAYLRYCIACHGERGDGRGPAAFGMWPPPRDFTEARFKFAGIRDRGLPHDRELERIVRFGLDGTGMKAWDLPDRELKAVVHYLKTFSPEGEGFRSERLEVKKPEIPPDPFQDAEAREGALARGEKLYHSYFECAKCHPSYVEPERFEAWDANQRAEDPYAPVPKWSPNYETVLLPPDFLRHPMRSVRETERGARAGDLYRVIAYGLQGPMPGYGHLGQEDVWAVAHYVKSLVDLRGTEEGRARRAELRSLEP